MESGGAVFQSSSNKLGGAKMDKTAHSGLGNRQQQAISLRNKHRLQQMAQRRREGNADVAINNKPCGTDSEDPFSFDVGTDCECIPLQLLPKFVELARNHQHGFVNVLHGTMMVRKLLSVRQDPPIHEVIQSGVLEAFAAYLSLDDYPDLQFESVWAISNVLSGNFNQCLYVTQIQHCVQNIVRLLGVTSVENIREQAAWAVGNLAGAGVKFRDYLIELRVVDAMLIALTQPVTNLSVMKQCAWAMANLVRNHPHPPLDHVEAVLPALGNLIRHHVLDIVQEACWAVSYISDAGGSDRSTSLLRVQALLNQGILPRVVELMHEENPFIQLPALRIVGNVITGSDDQTQCALECHCLNYFAPLLKSSSKDIRKECVWTVSNVAAGNKQQIQALIDANLFETVVKETLFDPEREVRKEAVWMLNNTASGCDTQMEQIQYMVETLDVLSALCHVLKSCVQPLERGECNSSGNEKLISVVLDTIIHIVGWNKDYIRLLEQTEIPSLVEALQSHAVSSAIYERCAEVISLSDFEDLHDYRYAHVGEGNNFSSVTPFKPTDVQQIHSDPRVSGNFGAFVERHTQLQQFDAEGNVSSKNEDVSGAFFI